MKKMNMVSADLIEKNVRIIGELFPNVITEVKNKCGVSKSIDFEKLKVVLSDQSVIGNEVYEFTWPGKREAFKEAYIRTRNTLRPVINDSINWDRGNNLYLEGDNLEILKLLQESYLGKVKMIYIDPPYNTGSDFIYHDSFTVNKDHYLEKTGVIDDLENKLVKNTNNNGRFHSDWCSMIYPRLLISRNLLREDGAIFISIDDHEVSNLKKICDEVFGEENFVAIFPWRKRTAKSDVPFGVSQDYEWILCYAKSSKFNASVQGKERKYYETPDFPGQPWRFHDLTKQTTAQERPNSYFTIINPKTGDEYPANPNSTWRVTKDTISDYLEQNRIIFPGDYAFLNIRKPVLRYWKSDDMAKAGVGFGKIAVSTKLPDTIGMSKDGTREITNLFSSKIFNYPKPVELVKYLISIATGEGDIVLDFFSGSGTTAQAVFELNAAEGVNRRFILVQLPEETAKDSVANLAGYPNICAIAKERIQKVIDQQSSTDEKIGMRVFKLDSSNMKDIFYSSTSYQQDLLSSMESSIKEDRTGLDLLFGCLLEWGLELSRPHTSEEVEGCVVYTYDHDALIACFSEAIPEAVVREVARRQPLRVVFRDSGFIDDAARVNVEEIFKLLSPDTEIKVI